jgi:hypothetical protein
MLSIEQQLMKIRSVTTVAEFKGDGREHAQNVKLEWTTDNGVLAEFDPQLRSAFYQKDDGKQKANNEGQGELSLPRQDVELTKLRIPFLQMPVKFKKEFAGYEMVYHCGASEKSNITLSEVELSDFSFDMKDGGTVLVVFNAYAKPNAADQGKIDQMMQLECEVTLTPPTEKQAQLAPVKETKKKKTAAEKADEDPFANTDIPAAQAAAAEKASGKEKKPMDPAAAWPFPSNPAGAH